MQKNMSTHSPANPLYLSWNIAKEHLQEGDVLLFRGKKLHSLLIQKITKSPYSHVGIASWHNDETGIWELIEFRGFRGGRTISLEREVIAKPGQIDVYRPISSIEYNAYNKKEKRIQSGKKEFNRRAVTKTMRVLTGLPYGWRRIWWLAQHHIPVLRFLYDINKIIDDSVGEIVAPVCSTAIAHAFSANDYDLLNNRADAYVNPGDLALSPMLNYLFTPK